MRKSSTIRLSSLSSEGAKIMQTFWRYTFLWTAIVCLTGCAGVYTDVSQVPEIKEVQQPAFPVFEPVQVAEGSLWSDSQGLSLYQDRRARRIGDVVVVRIEENPEASLSADTSTSKSSSLSAKLKFLGVMKELAENNANLAQNPGEDDLISAAFDSGFNGTGSSSRDGEVKAYISAVVVKVFPNGNLFINGKRQISVNNETQYIIIAGVIRPEDISTANEISSTYVADARIMYSGVGDLSNKQQQGWLGKAMDYVWPF
jgi:flagellar L-ring protein precursor FlgH